MITANLSGGIYRNDIMCSLIRPPTATKLDDKEKEMKDIYHPEESIASVVVTDKGIKAQNSAQVTETDANDDETDEQALVKRLKSNNELRHRLIYGVEEVPPFYMAIIFGLQQVLLSISSTLSIPLIVAGYICADHLEVVKAELLGTFLFMCGVTTWMQCTLGVRLPIIQGGCHKFIPAIAALMSLEHWTCPAPGSEEDETEVWQSRLREIQGCIILASITQVFIGCTGILGYLLKFIGPLTIAPTISLVGLSLYHVATDFCEEQWGIAALTVALVLLFSLYIGNLNVPFPACSRTEGCYRTSYKIFKLLPVILAIAISWSVCAILTASDVLSSEKNETTGYYARTDAHIDVLNSTKWFYFPYPGQWGMPTISLSGYMAMMAATFTSIIESVGDYYACARICNVPPPPAHAVNRGIAIEGLGSILSGAWGSGGATTSYSQNVGAIGFTKVGSRRAFQFAALIFIICAVIGKFGAVLTMMPEPVLGGIIVVSFGMVSAIGLSNLQYLDISSSRNQCILGLSLMIGLMLPNWLSAHPGIIKTGNEEVNNILTVLLSTSMFVGGFIGCVLDNTVPGTDEERGILKWRCNISNEDDDEGNTEKLLMEHNVYELPYITRFLRRWKICKYLPFLPTFHVNPRPCCWCCRKSDLDDSEAHVDCDEKVVDENKENDNSQTKL